MLRPVIRGLRCEDAWRRGSQSAPGAGRARRRQVRLDPPSEEGGAGQAVEAGWGWAEEGRVGGSIWALVWAGGDWPVG